MYVVIFEAELNQPGPEYTAISGRLRELALNEYGCIKINSVMEGQKEITISFWDSRDQISKWKLDTEHRSAQELGRSRFFKSYVVTVVEILHEYSHTICHEPTTRNQP